MSSCRPATLACRLSLCCPLPSSVMPSVVMPPVRRRCRAACRPAAPCPCRLSPSSSSSSLLSSPVAIVVVVLSHRAVAHRVVAIVVVIVVHRAVVIIVACRAVAIVVVVAHRLSPKSSLSYPVAPSPVTPSSAYVGRRQRMHVTTRR